MIHFWIALSCQSRGTALPMVAVQYAWISSYMRYQSTAGSLLHVDN